MEDKLTIKILVEDTSSKGFGKEHGLALWINYRGRNILFDTGQTELVMDNAKLFNVSISDTDAVVISHGHYDHTGGLPAVCNIAHKAKLYIHPQAVANKYSKKDYGAKPIGIPTGAKKSLNCKEIIWTKMPTELFPDVFITGEIPRRRIFEDTGESFFLDEDFKIADNVIDDQSMFIKTSRGIVVILGCAHSGVVNTVDYISELTGAEKIYAVIGGMHLLKANCNRINKTIEALKLYDVEKIMPLHCTGQEADQCIKDSFGINCMLLSAGDMVSF